MAEKDACPPSVSRMLIASLAGLVLLAVTGAFTVASNMSGLTTKLEMYIKVTDRRIAMVENRVTRIEESKR